MEDTNTKPTLKRSFSWRKREGISSENESFGELDMETLKLLTPLEQEKDAPLVGLTSQEAYSTLCRAIQEELESYNNAHQVTLIQDILNAFSPGGRGPISWITVTLFLLEVVLLLLSSAFNSENDRLPQVLFEAFVVLLMMGLNMVLCIREEALRRTEVIRKTKALLDNCEGTDCDWTPSSYPDTCLPASPSVSLIWAFRDGQIVNLPVNLLVEGDVVVLGTGCNAPTSLRQAGPIPSGSPPVVLEKGDVYNPSINECVPAVPNQHEAVQCQPCSRQKFVVLETPIRRSISTVLELAVNRPAGVLQNEMESVVKHMLERRVWFILVLSLAVNTLKIMLLSNVGHWTELLLMLQAYLLLPLLPLSFPTLWYCINFYGCARIHTVLTSGLTESPSKKEAMPLDDVLGHMWRSLLGDPFVLPRTSNMLHIIGNVTSWCCTDKEGILSFPNSCAEKVLFMNTVPVNKHRHGKHRRFHTRTGENTHQSPTVEETIPEEDDTEDNSHEEQAKNEGDAEIDDPKQGHATETQVHVLNLTFDPKTESGLRFDDVAWMKDINSLKPLGLNILLNASCSTPVKTLRLIDHCSHLSLLSNSTAIPAVTSCLCPLGREIGFVDKALKIFNIKQRIYSFRSTASNQAPFAYCHSYLSICHEKPVSYMESVIAEEKNTGFLQLLTHGSGDLVVDSCTDFWDGCEIRPLTGSDRRKVLDFYQRMSISTDCIAYSYRPVVQWDPSNKVDDVFLELPQGLQWINSDNDSASFSETDEERLFAYQGGQKWTQSVNEDNVRVLLGKTDLIPKPDIESYQRVLGGQIFIGMVAMQHQAKPDIMPLVEDLNNAGIRFVHFSSENELRSRVFAERMGLETGWNCHISLANDGALRDDHSTCSQSDQSEGVYMDDPGLELQPLSHEAELKEKRVSWVDKTQTNMHTDEECDEHSEHVIEEDGALGNDNDTDIGSSRTTDTDGDYWIFSNRAKLPRGIQNIRPHLANVDNVPLLVPLFTDSTPHGISEMVKIMQENAEVVCCFGSCHNVDNTDVFVTANLSVALEPLFPQRCVKHLLGGYNSQVDTTLHQETTVLVKEGLSHNSGEYCPLSPLGLSAALNSLPCSIIFHREDDIRFTDLLQEARRLTASLRSCFTFMLSCQLLLCLVMFLASCLVLPPPLTGLHLLWLSCIQIPVLSVSLLGSQPDRQLMHTMSDKNDKNFKIMYQHFTVSFVLGIAPTAFYCCVLVFPLILYSLCQVNSKPGSCHYLFGDYLNSSSPRNGLQKEQNDQSLLLAQDLVAFFMVLYFAFISTSFVHRVHCLWRRSPFSNRVWLYCACVVILLQVFYFTVSQAIWTGNLHTSAVFDLPVQIFIVILAWPIIGLLLCELLKRRYRKLYFRLQRRAKLKFGTKLGMNSPI